MEVRFQGFLDANPMNRSRIKEDPDKIIRQIKNSNRMSGALTAMFIAILAMISIAAGYFDIATGPFFMRMSISISLFLGLTFILIFFLNLMATTGFFNAGTLNLPSILPLSRDDLENLLILSFTRVFIAPAIIINVVFPVLAAIIVGPYVGVIALIGCLTTTAISIGALVKISRWFYIKSHSSVQSRLSSLVRVVAGLGIVIGMFATYSMIGVLPTMVQALVGFSTGVGNGAMQILAFVFPFNFGILAMALVQEGFTLITIVIAAAASILYGLLGIQAYRVSGKALRMVAVKGVTKSSSEEIRDVSVDVLNPISGIIRKDMKLATRNLGSIMIIVMPILMIFSAYPLVMLGSGEFLRSYSAIIGVAYLASFAGLSFMGLLSLDSEGASLHEGLPITTKMILTAKSRVFIIQYILTMSILFVWYLLSNPISPLILLLPIAQIPISYAVGITIGTVVYRLRGGGRVVAVNISGDQILVFGAMAVSAVINAIPLGVYALIIILTQDHLMAIILQGLIGIIASIIVGRVAFKLLKE